MRVPISILLGNGDGTFQAARSVVLPGEFPPGYIGDTALPQQPLSVAVGEFNADGKLDLTATGLTAFGVYGGYYNSSYVVDDDYANVLLGHGDGSFTSSDAKHVNVLVGVPSASAVAVADFNGDAKADLAVADFSSSTILLGNGDGTLQTPASPIYPGATSVAVGDFNADGKLDVASPVGCSISVSRGN